MKFIFFIYANLGVVLSVSTAFPSPSISADNSGKIGVGQYPMSDYHVFKHSLPDPVFPKDPYEILMEVRRYFINF